MQLLKIIVDLESTLQFCMWAIATMMKLLLWLQAFLLCGLLIGGILPLKPQYKTVLGLDDESLLLVMTEDSHLFIDILVCEL